MRFEALDALRSPNHEYIVWRRRQAQKIRDWLLDQMRNQCQNCGSDEHLEFHHPFGKVWKARSISIYNRMLRYRRDYSSGNLVCLCHDCHGKADMETFT